MSYEERGQWVYLVAIVVTSARTLPSSWGKPTEAR